MKALNDESKHGVACGLGFLVTRVDLDTPVFQVIISSYSTYGSNLFINAYITLAKVFISDL